MIHKQHRVSSCAVAADYTLEIGFDDSSFRVIDFRSILAGEIYGPLRDLNVFNLATIDPEVGTIVWLNGADFDPATLHDWPEHEPLLREMARRWNRVPA